MPPKKAARLKEKPQADPVIDPSAIPPSLPPSVEEAYRRKCIQLKQRTNEVEEENDATRLRLARIRRQIEKMRIERAFLLEQLTRRTSANVEDSEGSPSPPPATPSPPPRHSRSAQPQEKPLRTKRGHRKPSILADLDSGANKSSGASPSVGAQNDPGPGSPSSETLSQAQGPGGSGADADAAATNGLPVPPKKPADVFDLYCNDARPALLKARGIKIGEDGEPENEPEPEGDGELTIDDALARDWRNLPDHERETYQAKFEEAVAQYFKDQEAYEAAKNDDKNGRKATAEADKDGAYASDEPSAKEADDSKGEEDAEMKDDDNDNDSGDKAEPKSKGDLENEEEQDAMEKDKEPATKAEAEAESDSKSTGRTAAAAAAQDEDVEMADGDEEKAGDKSDTKDDD